MAGQGKGYTGGGLRRQYDLMKKSGKCPYDSFEEYIESQFAAMRELETRCHPVTPCAYTAIGQRIKALRKAKGMKQAELAQQLNKSLRTVQKYETGEIEISLSVVTQLADVLETSTKYLLGYEAERETIRSLSDIMDFLFKLEAVAGIDFKLDVKAPRKGDRECAISFDGKSVAAHNVDVCLFLEQWEKERDRLRTSDTTPEAYHKWQKEALAYYSAISVACSKQADKEDE